jgi:protein N-terminal methyltransferase
LHVAESVDIVEPVSKFTDQIASHPGVRNICNVGLESWRPQADAAYGLIWTQWCLGHLTDEQVVGYLETCKTVLTEDGVIVVKENLATGGEDLFDETDSSVTRLVLPGSCPFPCPRRVRREGGHSLTDSHARR